jgi:hypothetical protein
MKTKTETTLFVSRNESALEERVNELNCRLRAKELSEKCKVIYGNHMTMRLWRILMKLQFSFLSFQYDGKHQPNDLVMGPGDQWRCKKMKFSRYMPRIVHSSQIAAVQMLIFKEFNPNNYFFEKQAAGAKQAAGQKKILIFTSFDFNGMMNVFQFFPHGNIFEEIIFDFQYYDTEKFRNLQSAFVQNDFQIEHLVAGFLPLTPKFKSHVFNRAESIYDVDISNTNMCKYSFPSLTEFLCHQKASEVSKNKSCALFCANITHLIERSKWFNMVEKTVTAPRFWDFKPFVNPHMELLCIQGNLVVHPRALEHLSSLIYLLLDFDLDRHEKDWIKFFRKRKETSRLRFLCLWDQKQSKKNMINFMTKVLKVLPYRIYMIDKSLMPYISAPYYKYIFYDRKYTVLQARQNYFKMLIFVRHCDLLPLSFMTHLSQKLKIDYDFPLKTVHESFDGIIE